MRETDAHRRRETERWIIHVVLEPVFSWECPSVIQPS